MANPKHSETPNASRHLPKDFEDANNETALVKNVVGSLEYRNLSELGEQGPPGEAGPTIPETITGTIRDPIELNDLDNSGGDLRQVVQTITGNNHFSLYKYDASSDETENPPYSVDGLGANSKWVLQYSNSPLISEKSLNDAIQPIGFVDRVSSALSFVNGTRIFTITPTSPDGFSFYNQGRKYTKKAAENVTIDDVSGRWLIYYDVNGVLQATQSELNFQTDTTVAYIHWTGTEGIVSEERHSMIDWRIHQWAHEGIGTLYESGFAISGFTLNIDTNAAVTIELTGGEIHDEDLEHVVVNSPIPSNPFEQILSDPAQIPVVFLDSTGIFQRDTATDFPFKNLGLGRVAYNLLSGTWQQAEIADNAYAAVFLVVTSAIDQPIVAVQGQRQDASLTDAQDNNQFLSLFLDDFLSEEITPLYRIILQSKNTFGGDRLAKIVDVTDLRGTPVAPGTAVSPADHQALTSLQGGAPGERYHLTEAEHGSVKGIVKSALAALDIDMSGDKFKTKTLIANSIFTISNPVLGAVVQVEIDGDFSITLPVTIRNRVDVQGLYNGTAAKKNLLSIECIDSVTPVYWASIMVGD